MDSILSATQSPLKYGIQSTHIFLEDFYEPVEAIILIDNDKIFDVILINETEPEKLKAIKDQWLIENYGNLCIFPGLIDSNVHLHSDSDPEWDNIQISTQLAAAGGITTLIENPIMSKPFSNGEEYLQILQEKIDNLKLKSLVDFGVYGLLEPKTEEHIEDIVKLGVMGLKAYLFSCPQNGIGHMVPENLVHWIEYLNEHHPNLLLAFHPEVATERELYGSSPCRLSSLEERLDLNFEIKSLGLGGGANKGAYLEELNKSSCSVGFDDEDDDCPTPSLDTPSKLKSKIKKSKEKTEINQLVKFELMSYQFEESKGEHDSNSSDSDSDMMTNSNSQTPNLKDNKKTRIENKLSAKGNKKSIFGKEEIKEVTSEETESPPKSETKTKSRFAVNRRSLFASTPNKDKDRETDSQGFSCSPVKDFFDENSLDDKSGSKLSQDSYISPVEREPFNMIGKKNRGSNLMIAFHSKVSKILENDKQQTQHEELLYSENIDTAATKSPHHNHETIDESIKFSGSSRNLFSSGLINDHKTESPASEIPDSTRKLNINLLCETEKADKTISPDKNAGFSPDFNCIPQEINSNSQNDSPLDFDDQIAPPKSNLLLRRIVRKTSLNTPISDTGKPSLSLASRNFKIVNTLELSKSPNNTSNNNEHKFNVSYGILLANRPINWEENGVLTILYALKNTLKLRILIQNLSLASSFLRIRDKKKSDKQYLDTLYGETSVPYLFFNEKTVKRGETKYKATPAFRDKENRQLLIENFRLGGIDTVSSYHFYVPSRYKEVDGGNFRRAFGGFNCIGFNLQSLWTTMYIFYKKNNKKFNQEPFYQKKIINDVLWKMSRVLCSNPAKLLKIDHQKGKIEKGKDADFVVWDPYKLINNQNLPSTHIYSKRILYGLVHKTYLRGKVIYDKDDTMGTLVEKYQPKFLTPA